MTFFIDLWHDLREKRLWPVAVGLLAAIVAIPFVLAKSSSGDLTPAPAPIAAGPKTGLELPALSVDVNASDRGSKLDTFTQHNPFQPMKDLNTQPTASSPSSTGSTPAAAKGSTPSGSGSGSGSGASPSKAPSSSGSSGGSPTPSSQVVSNHTTTWIYTATFKFGTPDHMKTIKDAKPFTMLPDTTKASIIFASAGADGKSAIFYIQDTTFQAAGEGHCNAPGDKCRFVTLSVDEAHNEEAFISADGTTEYDVKLVSIGRKTLSDSASPSTQKKSSTQPTKGKRAAGAGKKDAAQASLDFLPVLLGFSNSTETRTVTHAR